MGRLCSLASLRRDEADVIVQQVAVRFGTCRLPLHHETTVRTTNEEFSEGPMMAFLRTTQWFGGRIFPTTSRDPQDSTLQRGLLYGTQTLRTLHVFRID